MSHSQRPGKPGDGSVVVAVTRVGPNCTRSNVDRLSARDRRTSSAALPQHFPSPRTRPRWPLATSHPVGGFSCWTRNLQGSTYLTPCRTPKSVEQTKGPRAGPDQPAALPRPLVAQHPSVLSALQRLPHGPDSELHKGPCKHL